MEAVRRPATLLFAFAASFAACSRAAPEAREAQRSLAPVEVRVARAEFGSIQRFVHATGTFYGEESAVVAAKVPGRIAAIHHDLGDVVKPGDPLADIEPTDFELAVAEQRRSFEQALARLGLAELPPGEFDVDALPAVDRARLQAENALARFERGRVLHERTPPAMSDQDYSDLRTAHEVARADQRLARLTAEAQLAEARALAAKLATAEQRLVDTHHRVPSGVRPSDRGAGTAARAEYAVTARRVSVGEFVAVGAPLFELVDPDPLELRVRIQERELARVRVGRRATATVEAYAEAFDGTVARVNPAVDVRTRTFEVEIVVPNADGRLHAGSFAKVAIEAELEERSVLVPASSVATFAGVNKVFGVHEGKAVERVVTLGERVGERWEIVKGLEAGDAFVLEPPMGLATGTSLREAAGSDRK